MTGEKSSPYSVFPLELKVTISKMFSNHTVSIYHISVNISYTINVRIACMSVFMFVSAAMGSSSIDRTVYAKICERQPGPGNNPTKSFDDVILTVWLPWPDSAFSIVSWVFQILTIALCIPTT